MITGKLAAPVRRVPQKLGRAIAAVALLVLAQVRFHAAGASAAQPPAPGRTLTSIVQIFNLTAEEKAVAYPISIEARVAFFDRRWHNLWLEQSGGLGQYLLLSDNPPTLIQGQRVRIEGTITPSKGLDAAAVTVTVLKEFEPEEPLQAEGRILDSVGLKGRRVSVQGYVDAERLIDDDHIGLALVVEGQPVIAWVKPDNPRSIPSLQGKFIEMSGLYEPRFDPTQTRITVEIWTDNQSDVTVVGSIEDSRLFDVPVTRIGELYLCRPN